VNKRKLIIGVIVLGIMIVSLGLWFYFSKSSKTAVTPFNSTAGSSADALAESYKKSIEDKTKSPDEQVQAVLEYAVYNDQSGSRQESLDRLLELEKKFPIELLQKKDVYQSILREYAFMKNDEKVAEYTKKYYDGLDATGRAEQRKYWESVDDSSSSVEGQ
jgi:hypothetical protein